jgi:hypothetical protein
MKSYGFSLFLPWANTHGKSMGTYVDLVASKHMPSINPIWMPKKGALA